MNPGLGMDLMHRRMDLQQRWQPIHSSATDHFGAGRAGPARHLEQCSCSALCRRLREAAVSTQAYNRKMVELERGRAHHRHQNQRSRRSRALCVDEDISCPGASRWLRSARGHASSHRARGLDTSAPRRAPATSDLGGAAWAGCRSPRRAPGASVRSVTSLPSLDGHFS